MKITVRTLDMSFDFEWEATTCSVQNTRWIHIPIYFGLKPKCIVDCNLIEQI